MPAKSRRKAPSSDGASVAKAISVLRAFVDGQTTWGVRELSSAISLPASSSHRLLQILRKEGLVDWNPSDQKYCAGMELFRWSAIVNRRFKLAEVARPIMSELASEFNECCWLGIYDQARHAHAYVAEALSARPFNYSARLAQYESLMHSAGGAAVLAQLPADEANSAIRRAHAEGAINVEMRRIRADGYAVRRCEDPDAPVTIAAVVFSARNVPAATLTLAVPRHRSPPEKTRELGVAVASAAQRLSKLIGSQVVGAAGTGSWHQGVNAIAALIHRDMPSIGSTIAARGGDGALRQLQAGEGGYCFAVADRLSAAYAGRAPFERPLQRLRAMFSLFPLHLHIAVHSDSKYMTFSDLRGARISAGDKDFTTAGITIELLQMAGLAKDAASAERRLVFLDYPEAHRQFNAGKLDAVIALTGAIDPAYQDLCRRSSTRILSLDRDLISKFVARHAAYEVGTIPGGSYVGCGSEARTLMVPTVMVTTADRGDEEVYDVTRAIFENRQELVSAMPGFDVFYPGALFDGIDIPLHPAAERFWAAQGLLERKEAK
jgi:TRAP transporter TAXI family solute receptor